MRAMRLPFSRCRLGFAATAAAVLLAATAAPAATFPAKPTSLGAIPDGLSGSCTAPQTGAPRVVTFAVKGLADTITNVEVTMTFTHPWAGDVSAVLIAPNDVSHTIFSRTSSLTTSMCGESSDLAGPYKFSDHATAQPSGGWWPAALTAAGATPIAAGTYLAAGAGGPTVPSAPAATSITPTFASVKPNGTWSLVLSDAISGDSGSISAASLTISAKDTIRPNTSFAKKPAKTSTNRTATFRFKSNEQGFKFRCKIDKRAWKACPRTKTFSVGPGKHTVRAQAIDKAGNKDATPASYSWTVVGA